MALEIGKNHYEEFEGYEFEVSVFHTKGLYRLSVWPVVSKRGDRRSTLPMDGEVVTVLKAARRSKARDVDAIAAAEAQQADLIQKVAAKRSAEKFSGKGQYD